LDIDILRLGAVHDHTWPLPVLCGLGTQQECAERFDAVLHHNVLGVDFMVDFGVQLGMMSACAVLTGSPIKHILNGEGRIDEAADKIIRSMEL